VDAQFIAELERKKRQVVCPALLAHELIVGQKQERTVGEVTPM
jgi:hypothetical protein